jgi:hypothetical protein
MKIHFLSRDPRHADSDFRETCGSFDVIQFTLEKGLRELGVYTDNIEEATYVGIADSLATDFNIPGKNCFIICFVDTINTIPSIVLDRIYNNPHLRVLSINQHTADLFEKYGVNCSAIGPGIDSDYWKNTGEKRGNNLFVFGSTGFPNFRSGIDQLIQAFDLAFRGNKDVGLFIKHTNDSIQFARKLQEYIEKGNNIAAVNSRWTFSQLRELYSSIEVTCNVLRMSAHGLPIAESTLCGSLCLAGDFNPSNRLVDESCGVLLRPNKEVYVDEVIEELVNQWGLANTFNHLSFPERPKIYSYDIEEYALVLKNIYENYSSHDRYKNRNRAVMVDKWDYLNSAQRLVSYLQST